MGGVSVMLTPLCGKLPRMRSLILAIAIGSGLMAATIEPSLPQGGSGRIAVYFGTYTEGSSQGIYRATFDPTNGRLSAPALAAVAVNPSFLAWHPGRQVLYAVSETNSGSVAAFAAAPDGRLTKINEQRSGGSGPCFVSVTPSGSHVLVANYGGGSVASFPVRGDGGLEAAASVVRHSGSSVTERQQGPHAHSIIPAPGERLAVAADLGIDRLLVYALNATTGRLTAHDPPSIASPPGSGPRHVVFHPAGDALYSTDELRSAISTYAWDAARGVLARRGTVSALPEGYSGANTTAEVAVHPTGRYVYGSNRGHDSIAVFTVNADRTLTRTSVTLTGGQVPRHFAVDPSGGYLLVANQRSSTITVFRIDRTTGALTGLGAGISVDSPVCVRFARPAR